MIKRIIFDIDNTLLDTEKDCLESYKLYFESKNMPDYSTYLYNLIDEYDANGTYNQNELVKYIDSHAPFSFSLKDFQELYSIYQKHGTLLEDDTPNILENLSEKYELVTLTNWYYEDQKARLQKAGILKYFSKIYALENAGLKPNRKVYEIASNGLNKNECLMVGDSLEKDVSIPISLGMKGILYNPKKITTEYKSIQKMSELLDLLKEENL